MSDDKLMTVLAAVLVAVAGAFIGTKVTQNLIYTKCLEIGQVVQTCKEITT